MTVALPKLAGSEKTAGMKKKFFPVRVRKGDLTLFCQPSIQLDVPWRIPQCKTGGGQRLAKSERGKGRTKVQASPANVETIGRPVLWNIAWFGWLA